MKLLKLGMVLVFILLITIAVLANVNNKDFSDEIIIEDGLHTFNEEICVDNFGDRTCTENIYVQCNGETYKVPKPTGFTIYKKIIEKEYIEKECSKEKLYGREKPSPVDRIKDSDLEVLANKIVIHIKNPKWRKFIDSNSMDPLIDEGTTTIEIKPKSAEEITVGDIIAFDVDDYDYAFVHRVVEIGNDEKGIYFITKGDNFYKEDSDKVRFSQVEGIVVGILY